MKATSEMNPSDPVPIPMSIRQQQGSSKLLQELLVVYSYSEASRV